MKMATAGRKRNIAVCKQHSGSPNQGEEARPFRGLKDMGDGYPGSFPEDVRRLLHISPVCCGAFVWKKRSGMRDI